MGERQWWIMVVDGYYWFKMIIMGDQWLLMAIPSHTPKKKSLGNCQFLDDFLWKMMMFHSYVKITRGYSGGNHDIIGYDIVDYNNSR